ncbi:MAG: restriction endonuclease subunit S [Bacteroidetes bacterium]|nr:restriction endonuclease subunit S [Bacteroidota bacterium]
MSKLKPYDKYKPSNIAWLGDIPEHWEVRKAKKLFRERSEKGFENEPFLAASQNKGVILKTMLSSKTVLVTKDFHTLKLVEKGDFVISLRSFQGGIEYAYYRGIISPAYTILKPLSNVYKGYYRHYFKSKEFINCLTLLVTGIREGQNIDTAKFKDTFLPLPPHSEQIVIANFLDYKIAKIDRFIHKKKQLIKLLNEQKAGIINDVVTKGLDTNVKMKDSGIEWLGNIPEHWEISKLKWFAKTTSGATPLSSNQKDYYDGDIPWIRSTDLTDNYIYLENVPIKITNKAVSETACSVLPIESVLVAMYGGAGTIGKNGLIQIEAVTNQAVCGIYPSNKVTSRFLQFYLHFFRPYWMIVATGTRKDPNIGQDAVKNMILPIPPLIEQVAIVNHIEKETEIISKTIATIEKEITLVQEYRTALIAEAVTGKIDVCGYKLSGITDDETFDEELRMIEEDETDEFINEEIE